MILLSKIKMFTAIMLGALFIAGMSSLFFADKAYAAPPRCYTFNGAHERACEDIGIQLQEDKCYTELRYGPNAVLSGYNETSCADPTDRDMDGNPGGRTTTDTSSPPYVPNDCNDPDGIDQSNCGIIRYLVIFINFLSAIAGIAIIGSIIYGGIQYSMAGSDPQKVSAAKNRMRDAIIALLFFLFGYGLLNYLVPGGVIP